VSSSVERPARSALRTGLEAARRQLKPVLLLQLLLAGVVASYFAWSGGPRLWQAASAALSRGGLVAVFLAGGIFSGLVAEAAVVLIRQRGRWTGANTVDAAVRFVIYGTNAVLVSLFYGLQARLFGDVRSVAVVARKVAFEAVLFAPFVSLPLQLLGSRFSALGFDGPALLAELKGRFFRDFYRPGLVVQWMFWPLVSCVVYSFPLALQTPVFLVIGAIWALLLAALAKPEGTGESPGQ